MVHASNGPQSQSEWLQGMQEKDLLMKNRRALFVLISTVALLAVPALAQTEENVSEKATTVSPVAYVYVQTTPGVVVYSTAANGILTEVNGSPFKVSGQMEDISGKFLISVGDTILHVYSIASNGAVGKQISQINTASYGGSECGGTSGQGSVVDHTGKYLYVQLNTLNKCAAWQTYRIEPDGFLQFLGHTEAYQLYYEEYENLGNQVIASTVPTVSSNDKFQYGIFNLSAAASDNCFLNGAQCPNFSAFKTSGGVLEENSAFTEKDPVAEPGDRFIPWSWNSPRADGNGHLAVLMDELYDSGDYSDSRLRVASFTINPTTGALTSTNTHDKMPVVQVNWYPGDGGVPGPENSYQDGNEDGGGGWYNSGPFSLAMSPAGNILAVAGNSSDGGGIQLFHFNGAAEATNFGNEFYEWPIDQLMWDSKNHLYALDYALNQLTVFTVTTKTVTQTGSPYSLPKSPYGTKGLIVVSK
jgi:hypothetical protein